MQSPDTDPNTASVSNPVRMNQSLGSFQNLDFSLLLNKGLFAGCSLSILQIEMIMILYLSNTGGILQRKITETEWDIEILH